MVKEGATGAGNRVELYFGKWLSDLVILDGKYGDTPVGRRPVFP